MSRQKLSFAALGKRYTVVNENDYAIADVGIKSSVLRVGATPFYWESYGASILQITGEGTFDVKTEMFIKGSNRGSYVINTLPAAVDAFTCMNTALVNKDPDVTLHQFADVSFTEAPDFLLSRQTGVVSIQGSRIFSLGSGGSLLDKDDVELYLAAGAELAFRTTIDITGTIAVTVASGSQILEDF